MQLHKYLVLLILGALLLTTTAQEDDEEEEDDDDNDSDSSTKTEDDGVLVLTKKNFDEVINKEDTVLVEFYAPWCGHCKSLAPEYAQAAKILKENDPPLTLAKVDATVESELAEKYDVSGYPTIKLFKKGEASEYDGARTSEGIVEFMKKRGDPNWKPPPESVVTITKDNFEEFMASGDLVLVEFYAPWCGHCKKLAPEYERAAKRLKAIEEPIPLGKVDATVEKELAEKYKVTGYPTLKMFRKGREQDYLGGRDASGIINYMMKQQGEASKLKHNETDIKNYFKKDQVTIMGFFDNINDPMLRVYMDAANDLREDYDFGHTFSEEARNHFKVNPKSVVVFAAERFFTKYENKYNVFEKVEFTVDDVKEFVVSHRLPLVAEYTHQTEKFYKDPRPLCIVFYTVDWSHDHKKATESWRQKVAKLANNNRDIGFAIADEEEMLKLIKEFNLEESGEEVNIGCYGKDSRRYKLDEMDEWDEEDINDFLNKMRKGQLKPQIRSQKPPKKQGLVKTVVGSTFEKIVYDKTKDVLIELYAPWCGHCKELEPKYKKLAQNLKKEKNLVIAKMDATANEAPPAYKVGGFPTIYFAPANNKNEPKQFDRSREVEDFEKFLREHATVSFGKTIKDEL